MLEIVRGSTTMIGSMPQATAEQALESLHRYPLSIPAWPQLPNRTFKEAMIPQFSEGFPGVHIDEDDRRVWVERDGSYLEDLTRFFEDVVSDNSPAFALTQEYAAGFDAHQSTVRKQDRKVPVLKGQVTGPFTFGLGLLDDNKQAVWYDEQYKEIVLEGLRMRALWMLKELQEYAERVLVFVDEPVLSALGTPVYLSISEEEVVECLNQLYGAVKSLGGVVGTHCCGNMDWGLLAKTNVDIIAFDAFTYGEKIALYPEEMRGFLDRGGILAWGIVPTDVVGDRPRIMDLTFEDVEKRLEELHSLFIDKGFLDSSNEKQTIFTPSCGMGSLSDQACDRVLEFLSRLSPR